MRLLHCIPRKVWHIYSSLLHLTFGLRAILKPARHLQVYKPTGSPRRAKPVEVMTMPWPAKETYLEVICWVRDPGLPLWATFAECTLSENHVVLYDWVGDLLAKKNHERHACWIKRMVMSIMFSYFYNQCVVQTLLFTIPYDVHPFWRIDAHHHPKKWKVSGFIDYLI